MIINNLTRKNHLYHLLKVSEKAVELIIISPYITSDNSLFPFEKLGNLKKVTIVTTIKPFEKDQYSKINYFKYLFNQFNARNVKLKILIENTLHGKIFISKFEDSSASAIITSANFTNNGLKINNEWGVLITDLTQITELENGVIQKIRFKELDENQIDLCIEKMKENPLPNHSPNPIYLNLTTLFEQIENYHQIESGSTFWLKPIGVTENIISKDEKFDEVEKDLHFSKLKPKGIKKGDILICYAVGHLNILSIYKVESEVIYTGNQNDRWPYFVVGKNLTPNYGREWSKENINITGQKKEFISQGVFNITPSGKNSYGSLMRGADKLRLTPEFGNYLLKKIGNIDEELQKT